MLMALAGRLQPRGRRPCKMGIGLTRTKDPATTATRRSLLEMPGTHRRREEKHVHGALSLSHRHQLAEGYSGHPQAISSLASGTLWRGVYLSIRSLLGLCRHG